MISSLSAPTSAILPLNDLRLPILSYLSVRKQPDRKKRKFGLRHRRECVPGRYEDYPRYFDRCPGGHSSSHSTTQGFPQKKDRPSKLLKGKSHRLGAISHKCLFPKRTFSSSIERIFGKDNSISESRKGLDIEYPVSSLTCVTMKNNNRALRLRYFAEGDNPPIIRRRKPARASND